MEPNKETVISLFNTRVTKLLPEIPKTTKTYLEILKISNREVQIANLLAYFFDPQEDHGLKLLFIRSLLETICHNLKEHGEIKQLHLNGYLLRENVLVPNSEFLLNEITGVSVHTEKRTDEQKRIDIIIEAKQFVIAIEFKINHLLDNPLADYEKHVLDKYCRKEDKPVFFVVLTPAWKKHENPDIKNHTFKQVILSSFIENVKHNLTDDVTDKIRENYYYKLLLDFIQTIENRKKHAKLRAVLLEDLLLAKDESILKLFNALDENKLIPGLKERSELEVRNLLLELIAIKEDITDKLKRLSVKKDFKNGVTYKKVSCFEGFAEVKTLKNIPYTIKARLTLKGWKIEKWEKATGLGCSSDLYPDHFDYETSSNTMAIKVSRVIQKELYDINGSMPVLSAAPEKLSM